MSPPMLCCCKVLWKNAVPWLSQVLWQWWWTLLSYFPFTLGNFLSKIDHFWLCITWSGLALCSFSHNNFNSVVTSSSLLFFSFRSYKITIDITDHSGPNIWHISKVVPHCHMINHWAVLHALWQPRELVLLAKAVQDWNSTARGTD